MNHAFFDLETTGASPAFDHPLQFAAILTDANFKEIERVNMRCRLAPHVIPSPQALAVTGMRLGQLLDPSLPSLFEFTQSLSNLISRWSPAIWTGFNSIRFDEEMLRQAFYQNLQAEIFATQFNGNNRFDIMTAVFAVWVRCPTLFEWPVDETGAVRFKLDRLAPLNGFEGHNAHDALGDVEATIHLASKIALGAPELWAELLANREKAHVQNKLEGFEPLELIGRFGAGPPKSIIGCLCGYSSGNAGRAYFFDLNASDPADLIDAPDEALVAALSAVPRIVRSVSINKAPALLMAPTATDQQRHRATLIAKSRIFRERVVALLDQRIPVVPEAQTLPVEKQIFNGFYKWSDKARLKEFQTADWPRRQEIAASFDDKRLRQLGRRLIAFYAHELLSEGESRQFADWRKDRWRAVHTDEKEWLTLDGAREMVAQMRIAATCDADMLDEVDSFLAQCEKA